MSEIAKIKWILVYLVMLLLIFGAQSYYLYFKFIPETLAPYAGFPAIRAQVQSVIYSMAGETRFWFLALAGNIVGWIVGLYVNAKKKSRSREQ